MRLLAYFLLLGICTLCSIDLSANTFIGGYEGNIWGDYRNWSDQSVPGGGDEATIPNNKTVYVDGARSVGSLILAGSLNSDGNPNSKLTIISGFSWTEGSVNVPVELLQGCGALWVGGLGLSANLTNHGAITLDANMTFSNATLFNYGELQVSGAHNIGVYYAPATIENHGTMKKPIIDGSTFNIGILLLNQADGDVFVENGELYVNIHCKNYGHVDVTAGAVFHTHTLEIYDSSTFSGDGEVKITGNGMNANNTVPVTFGNAETSMSANGFSGSGAIIFPRHFTGLNGSIQNPVTIEATGVVDINAGGVGIVTSDFINNGTFNINSNLTFSYGKLTNYGTVALTGGYTIGIYAAAPGIFNHGTVVKPASSVGTFNMGVPLHNEPGGQLLVQHDELYCSGNLYNSSAVHVSAGAVLRVYDTHIYDGATFTGAGMYINTGNGIFANNSSSVSIDFAETNIAANVGGSGPLTFTGHINWTAGGFSIPVTLAGTCVTDLNPGAGGIGGNTTTNYGILNVNSSFTLSAGEIQNYGQILLNGPHTIGIYYGTPGIFNHGTVKKPTGSAGVFNMGVPLTNHADGLVVVEEGELKISSTFSNYGNLNILTGSTFRPDFSGVYDGASVTGGGTYIVQYNGLTAYNTANVNFDNALTKWQSTLNGSGPLTFSQQVDWESANLHCWVTIAAGGTLALSTNGNHGIFGTLTNNGVVNANVGFGGNGVLVNNAALNLGAGITVSGNGVVNNTGTIQKNAGGDVVLQFNLLNTGAVVVPAETLFLGGLTNAGVIDVSSGATVRLDGYLFVNSFETGCAITGAGTFELAASLGVNADVALDIATFNLSGNLSGMNSLTFNHTLNATNASIENTVIIAPGGVMFVDGVTIYGVLTNNGVLNGNGNLLLNFNALVQNNGVFNLNADAALGSPYGYYASGTLDNAGTFIKSSAGTAQASLIFNNLSGATLSVNNGVLEVIFLDNAGAISIAAGATLIVKDGNQMSGGVAAGSGTLRVEGNGWHLENSLTIDGLIFEIAGALNGEAGATLEVQGNATWFSGDIAVPVNIAAGGVFNTQGYGSRYISSDIINNGTFNSYNGWYTDGDVVNNGMFVVRDNGGFSNYSGKMFTNSAAGVLKILDNPYGLYISMVFLNNGSIQVEEGILYLDNGLENNAAISVQPDATLSLGGDAVFNSSSNLNFLGSLAVTNSLTLNLNVTFAGQNFELAGNLLGPNDLFVNTAMDWNYGNIQTDVSIAAGATLNIGGYGGSNKMSGKPAKKFLQLNVPLFALHPLNGQTLAASITNNGTTIQNGTYDMDGGVFTNNGQFTNYDNSIYDAGAGGTFTNNGTWDINYSFGCYVNAVNNGVIRGEGYYITFEPELQNNGAVSPGFSPGQMVFQHNYVQGTALEMEVESSSGPGYGHDFILAEENLQLGGALNVSETGVPLNGEYVILRCNGGPDCRTGTFSAVSLPADYSIEYRGDEVVLHKGQPIVLSPADTTICSGNGVTIAAPFSESYEWSTGETTQSIEVYPYYTTTYSVTVYDANGNGTIGNASVNVNEAPYAYIYPGYSTLCQGESATLTIYTYSNEQTYLWSTGETTESITVSPNTEVTYFATVTAPGGCSAETSATVLGSDDPAYVPNISGIPAGICASDPDIFLDTYQDGYYGLWSGNGVYYGYLFSPYGLSGPQVLTFTPYAGQCAAPATWTIDVSAGIYYEDADGDGYGNPAVSQSTCTPSAGYVADNSDCDDTAADVHPGAVEICNGLDDDCDGLADEGAGTIWYADADGDDYGDPNVSIIACDAPLGYIGNNLDCDDSDSDINPGAIEICNGLDDNCDGLVDEGIGTTWYADADGDGYGDNGSTLVACAQPAGYVPNNLDCNDADPNVHPGATEICNNIDDDCDGLVDEGDVCDNDADGYTVAQGDCDDNNAAVHPGATEICNGIDDDCDGLIDEGVGITWYADSDGDGYGNAASTILACTQPAGYVSNSVDCDDANPNVHPGAIEICNNIDDDCDGEIDETTLSLELSAGNVSCSGGNAILIAVGMGGHAPYLYSVDGGDFVQNSPFPVGAGSHTVVVRDAYRCEVSQEIDIAEPNAILIDPILITNVACGGGKTGAVDITVSGGTPNYSYHWSNNKTTQDIGNLAGGTYSVTVTDAGGCTAVASAIVNPKLKLTLSKTNTTCHAGNDGTVTAQGSFGTPDYSYLWETGATTATLTDLTPGAYRVTLTDATGCTRSASISVGQPAAVNISGTVENVACNGDNSGSIAVTVTNGVAPFQYTWSDGATTEDRDGLAAGSYTLLVTDVNGCSREKTFSIGQPTMLTLSFTYKNVTCNGAENGEINASAGGGKKFPTTELCHDERYCFNWSNGATTRKITGLTPGAYTLSVTDANGCMISGSVVITQPDILQVTEVLQEQLPNGKYRLTVSADGGTPAYKFKRLPGTGYQASNVFSNVPTGIYNMIVRDANLCEDTLLVHVPETSARELLEARAEMEKTSPATGHPESLASVFPNPAYEHFNLKLNKNFSSGSIRVFNMSGNLIAEISLESGMQQYQFSVQGWPAGIYLVQVQTENEKETRRVVVGR